jgi:hypothetical protein
MTLFSEMSPEERIRCIDLHFDSTATLAKSIAVLETIADDVVRDQADRDEAAAEATEAQRELSLQDARWKMARLGEQGLNPPSPEQVKTAHALSQKVAKLNAATAAVAAVVTVTKAVADALQKFNGTVPGDEA